MSNTGSVLVVGDANLDLILRGDVRPRFGQAEQLLDEADLTLGGSAALVASALARLGVPVTLCAAVGADSFGELTLDLLRAAGVGTDHVVRRPASATGLSVILSDGDRAILTHLGAVDSLRPDELPDPAALSARHLHLASVYLVRGIQGALPALLRAARSAGASTSVDTNDDPERTWTGLSELLAVADVVLPNEGEVLQWAAALGEPDTAWQRCAASVALRGPTVVVKRGADGGAVVRAGVADVLATAPPTMPVDTTGAGDCFDAAWIAARLDGVAAEDALAWAVEAGALSTQRPGGYAAQPTRAELTATRSAAR